MIADRPVCNVKIDMNLLARPPYLPINLRHKVLRPYIDVDYRVATSMHLVAMLKLIDFVPRDGVSISKTVDPCIRMQKYPDVQTFLCKFYNIIWPDQVKLIRLCNAMGCRNPWHYQTVAVSFDEGAYILRKKERYAKGVSLSYSEQRSIITGEKV